MPVEPRGVFQAGAAPTAEPALLMRGLAAIQLAFATTKPPSTTELLGRLRIWRRPPTGGSGGGSPGG